MHLLSFGRTRGHRGLLVAGVGACLGLAAVVGTVNWSSRSLAAPQTPAPSVAGRTATQWADSGVIIGAPTRTAGVAAQVAEENAVAQFGGSIPLGATLVHMSMPGSAVVPNADYWAVEMAPSPAVAAPVGGPAGAPSQSPMTHMVVFLNAETGAYVVAQLWN